MYPLPDHVLTFLVLVAQSLLLSHALGIVECELIGQHLQQVARPAFVQVAVFTSLRPLDVGTEEHHLAPHIVPQRPDYKVLDALFPLLTVGHVENTGFQPRDDTRPVRQVPVGLILRQPGKLGTLLLQLLGQFECLLTFYQSSGRIELVDIRLQCLVESEVVEN